ncbi:hypothetical protein RHMOL_RhmolUnG0006200 [Rhododendron molle]|nr:hypothetical protein RHMOL_RhmolUnG0006200 [Rhododendron molle]
MALPILAHKRLSKRPDPFRSRSTWPAPNWSSQRPGLQLVQPWCFISTILSRGTAMALSRGSAVCLVQARSAPGRSETTTGHLVRPSFGLVRPPSGQATIYDPITAVAFPAAVGFNTNIPAASHHQTSISQPWPQL